MDTPAQIAAAYVHLRQQRVMKTFGEPLHSLQLDDATFGAARDLLCARDSLDYPELDAPAKEMSETEKAFIEEQKTRIDQELDALLGERRYEQLKVRVEVRSKQDEIRRELAMDMLDAAVPLDAIQMEELALSYVKAWRPGAEKLSHGNLLADAKSILTAEQFAVLERFEQQREHLEQVKLAAAKNHSPSPR